mgnify:CR=1 FL=1
MYTHKKWPFLLVYVYGRKSLTLIKEGLNKILVKMVEFVKNMVEFEKKQIHPL